MADLSTTIKEWYPLESSPDVFTSMARQWGLPEHIAFYDVYGLDEESLALAPGPVHAVILLFPDTEEIVKYRKEVNGCIEAGQGLSGPLWIPQTDLVGHSCGTFAMIHAFASLGLTPLLDPFFDACRAVPPEQRTQLFSECDLIRLAHNGAVTAGQTELRETDWEECDHFLSFVAFPAATLSVRREKAEEGGRDEMRLMEMDGNTPRTGPLDRGPCTDLLRNTARVVREEYLPRAGDNVHFSMMVLAG